MGRPLILIAIVAAVSLAFASGTSTTQAKKPSTPKSEQELRALLKKGAYEAPCFTVRRVNDKYAVIVYTEKKNCWKAAKDFFGKLKISQAKLVWSEAYTDMRGERAMVGPVDFVAKLPYETSHYRIEFDDYDNRVVVVPNVDVRGDENPVSELTRLWPTYQRYCNEAVAWMKQQRYQKGWFEIEFWMQDFWPKGKKISF